MSEQKDKCTSFVDHVFELCQKDNGLAARLRRADNPSTEYQCWEVLARFGVQLDFEAERLPYALIAACIAKSDATQNGKLSLGKAISKAFPKDSQEQANARLRRLLACDNNVEACKILRPMMSLIRSRVDLPLDYAQILRDLVWFNRNVQRTRARWATDFYRYEQDGES